MSKRSQKTSLLERITPEKLYLSRRRFLQLAAAFGSAYALAACGIKPEELDSGSTAIPAPTQAVDDVLTPEEIIANYNNYYEFSVYKEAVASLAKDLKTSPWPIEISGLVRNPMTIDAADLIAKYPAEERVYRLRCVEGWSMVIPWYGFPLHKLLKDLEVKPGAGYITFTTLADKEQMPGIISPYFKFPYVEGLRLDEAMHDLTFLAWGVYQKPLPPQEGAPLRLVVPWKYGFKSSKSIVKIELVKDQPRTFWSDANPMEYGFYSNVNPEVDHPRWSQATERRIGEDQRRPTLKFNGYDEVAPLYEGMDLRVNF